MNFEEDLLTTIELNFRSFQIKNEIKKSQELSYKLCNLTRFLFEFGTRAYIPDIDILPGRATVPIQEVKKIIQDQEERMLNSFESSDSGSSSGDYDDVISEESSDEDSHTEKSEK